MEKLNRTTLLDDAKRPKAPRIAGLTPVQRSQGRRLRWFHNMHREQLKDVARAMARIDEDASLPLEKIAGLHMQVNIRNFGNLCGQECQMLSGHHGIEDAYVFPALQAEGSAGLKKVVERLAAEHLVVHQLIDELNACAVAATQSPSAETYAALKSAFTVLSQIVHSHFGYEETELEEALGVIDVGF
jgi:hemerythrin-like domain-containing protein